LIDRHPDTRFIIDHLAILQPRKLPAPLPFLKTDRLGDSERAMLMGGACELSSHMQQHWSVRPCVRPFLRGTRGRSP
jgi:hypothetical protein